MFVTRYSLPHHVVVENDTRIYRRNSVLDMFQCRQARRSVSRVLSRPWITPWGRGWPFIWDARRRAPHATDPSGGAEDPPGGLSRDSTRLPLLLGLAPGGVCPAAAVAGSAVRSYRTISPLPPTPRIAAEARRCVSVALSLGSPPPGVTRHRTSVEPGLSSLCPASRLGREQPSDRLAWD